MKNNKLEHVDLKQLPFFSPLVLTEDNMILNQHSVFMIEGTELTEVWHIPQPLLPGLLDQCKQVGRTSRNITCCSRMRSTLIWSCWLHMFSAHLNAAIKPLYLPHTHCFHTVFLSVKSFTCTEVWCKINQNYSSIFYSYLFDRPALALCKLLYTRTKHPPTPTPPRTQTSRYLPH